jgi:hypothetical protein
MPNERNRHKKTGAQTGKSGSARYGKPRSLTDLLARPSSPLTTLQRRARAAGDWLTFVQAVAPAHLAPHVTSAVERGHILTIYVASAAWAARLKFTAETLLAQARGEDPDLQAVRVKVMPQARGRPAR